MGIHGLLLKVEFGWLQTRSFYTPKQRPLSITLAIKQPLAPVTKKAETLPVVPEKPSLNKPVPRKKKAIPREPMPAQQKRIKPPAQPVVKKRPIPALKTASGSSKGVESTAVKPSLQIPTTEDIRSPAPQTMIEARPLYRLNPPPKYPAMAKRRGYTGQVVLDVLVAQSGRVADLRVSTSSGYGMLDEAAVAAVKTWVFEPAVRGNQKVKMWVRVPIRFELK